MERDPIDTLTDALFAVGMLASLVLLVLPASKPKPLGKPRCCCGGPVGPTGNTVLDMSWRKAREA